MRSRAATTLLELVVVIAMLGALMGIAVPPIAASLDRAAVHAAADDASSMFALARDEALAYHAPIAVVLDRADAAVVVRRSGGRERRRPLGALYGVALQATRDSMRYDGRGLGVGAANLTLVVARGRARDTLFVSRLGRVRR